MTAPQEHQLEGLPETISGVAAMRAGGGDGARGFWSEAWAQVLKRRSARISLVWVGLVAFIGCTAPLIATGHPILLWRFDEAGRTTGVSSPLASSLTGLDWLLALGSVAFLIGLLMPMRTPRALRAGVIVSGFVQAVAIVLFGALIRGMVSQRDAGTWLASAAREAWFVPATVGLIVALVSGAFAFVPSTKVASSRTLLVVGTGLLAGGLTWLTWSMPPATYTYRAQENAGTARTIYTLIPFSPMQRAGDRDASVLPPLATDDQALSRVLTSGLSTDRPLDSDDLDRVFAGIDSFPLAPEKREQVRGRLEELVSVSTPPTTRAHLTAMLNDALSRHGHRHLLGTDSLGQDVLSQMLHACRLAISIGLVSTGIATLIGVTMGALMGYFGGLVDLFLYRIVEVFMAVPILFLLIVAAGVLPRNTYVMMAIIGCFTWHGAARYTRAEFLKLRNQDFVQSARAVGLPLRSILFRHMLPNGVTPVLVDASFLIAAAILFEATLSYLGLGPAEQASWGRLLSDATGEVGDFVWWLAIFPGLVIFLTVLSLTLIGEALRDAIDPKLAKSPS